MYLLDIYQRRKAIEGGAVAAKQQVLIFTQECDKMVALSSISEPQLAKWDQEVTLLLEKFPVRKKIHLWHNLNIY